MKINKATIDLVRRFEGLELEAYRDPVGVVTIGYGYTNKAGFGPGVQMGNVWTEKQANDMLIEGLERFGQEILPMMTRRPTANQFGAMLSLAYNIGSGAFGRSTCLRRFNAGDIEGAAEALTWFNKAGGKVLRGLVRRRTAEMELFLKDAPLIDTTPKADPERTATSSTTLGAVIGAGASGATGMGTAVGNLDGTAQIVAIVALAFLFAFLAWIFRERLKKLARGI